MTPRNRDDAHSTEIAALRPEKEKRVAAGLAEFQRVFQDCEDLRRAASEQAERFKLLELECDRATTEVERLQAENAELRRLAMQAISERVAYESVFRIVTDTMQSFTPPVEPAKTRPAERLKTDES